MLAGCHKTIDVSKSLPEVGTTGVLRAVRLDLPAMKAALVVLISTGTFLFTIAAPRPAVAQQSGDSPGTAVSDVGRSLKLPASLFQPDRREDDDRNPPSALNLNVAFAPVAEAGIVRFPIDPSVEPPQETRMRKMILYGLQLTFYEHVMRIATQDFTRQQLKGEFWNEYIDSVHVPDKWHDKDGWQVNYIGHAISGGAYTRIWMDQREPRNPTKSQYLKSIGKALIYTTLFSIQYEMGPMSEASIGNVGLNPEDLGWNDYIWTPIGGVLWTMGEDAIDKYALTWVEKHVPFLMAKAAARMIANPSRMLANIGQNRTPWSRKDRGWDGLPIKR